MTAVAAGAASVSAKVRRRVVPFLFVLYVVAYLDRINVGFAALQMNAALGLSATTFGLGAGMFFLSYVAFEIPSNVVLARIGARVWIARIMITWGLVSSATMFVRGAGTFYAARFLLGAAEAGFFPGIIFYLTRWFPTRERARTIALFMTANVVAGVVGGPISGALLALDGTAGLAGWQWLFVLEGLPAIILGVVVLFALTERPQEAGWLDVEERRALLAALDQDAPAQSIRAAGGATASRNAGARTVSRNTGARTVVRNAEVWRLAAVYFTIPVALYGVSFWLPQVVRAASRAGSIEVGLLTAIPNMIGAVAMVLAGRHSDRTGERRWHVAVAALVGAAGFELTAFTGGLASSIAALSLAMLGLSSMFGPFWTMATSLVGGVEAAVGIALINSVGNIGGFVGPYLLGALRDATGSFAAGFVLIGLVLAGGGILVSRVRSEPSA